MTLDIERLELLLLVAVVVSMLARRLRLPYTVGLTFAGILITYLPLSHKVALTRELIFTALLPPLIFETAIKMEWSAVKREIPVTLTLATVGVFLSSGAVAAGIHYFLGWPWTSALLLAVLISATDPVSVIATFGEIGVKGRLRMLVESESLFNDGTVAVAFAILLASVEGNAPSGVQVAQSFAVTIAGGIACGAVLAVGCLLLAGRTEDHLVEIAVSSLAAYGSFLLAEHFHLSGVLATLTAGLVMGNFDKPGKFTDRGKDAMSIFWAYVGFVANSLIFLLIGVQLANKSVTSVWVSASLVIALMLVGRAIAVYGCCPLFAKSALRVKPAEQHVLFWGGLRGALALALALSLPATVTNRSEILNITFGVVAFSVIVQGLTITPLMRYLGIVPQRKPKVEPVA